MAPRDEDMDWLYRNDEPEPTAVLRPDEVAGLRQSDADRTRPPYDSTPPRQHPAPGAGAGAGSGRPPLGPPPTAQGASSKRRRGGPRRVLKVLLALLVAWLVFLVGVPIYAWSATTKVDTTPPGDRPASQPGTTILLVGSDGRSELTDHERKVLGTGSTEGQRTDTMMLLNIPAKGDPVLLSLPRDSLVEIPGHKPNKLNAAYAFGGAPLLVQTVEKNTGIRVDGYLEVGFLGIVKVVDAVGGIQVCPTFDFDDKDAHIAMKKGCQQVDGVTALGYVRMRKADPRGDLGRMERQREVISAILKKVASPMSILNPVRYWQLNMAASQSLARGNDTGITMMPQVALGLASTMSGKGISMTVPVSEANARVKGVGSVMRWDEKASSEVFAAIASGDTTSLARYRR